MEAQICLAIIVAGAQGKQPTLLPPLRKHLEECESCREQLVMWNEKAKSTKRARDSYDIVNEAATDATILRKHGRSAIAYFKPHSGGDRGLLVLVTSDNVILDPEEITREAFENLTL